MQTDLLKLRESQGISYFLSLLRGAGIANPEAIVDGKQLDGRSTSKVFNDTMRKLGYGKQDLGFWNNRPAYWVRED